MIGLWLRTPRHYALLALGLLCISGCGGSDGVKLHHVSGKVSFDGKPVTYGTIEFIPDSAKGNTGPATSAEIEEGTYDTSKGGRGVLAGAYQVRITAYEQRPQTGNEDETKTSTAQPPLFVGYAMTADELKDTKDFDVPEAAKGFGLTSSAPVRRPNDP